MVNATYYIIDSDGGTIFYYSSPSQYNLLCDYARIVSITPTRVTIAFKGYDTTCTCKSIHPSIDKSVSISRELFSEENLDGDDWMYSGDLLRHRWVDVLENSGLYFYSNEQKHYYFIDYIKERIYEIESGIKSSRIIVREPQRVDKNNHLSIGSIKKCTL